MNGTRIAAWHGLFVSFIRMLAAINSYIARHPTDEKIQKLKLSDSQVADLLVFEGVFDICATATTLAQYEKYFTGAFGAIIRIRVLEQLRNNESKPHARGAARPRTLHACRSLRRLCPGPVMLTGASASHFVSPLPPSQSASSTARRSCRASRASSACPCPSPPSRRSARLASSAQ